MNEIIRKVKYRSEKLAGFKLPCYVLEDGTRILSGRGMQEALRMVDEGDKQSSGGRLVENLSQKSLQPFIYEEKRPGGFEPIICYDGNKEIHGYEATVLVDICNVYIEARKHIKLSPRQKIIADQCGIILGAFAKVGIYALIDEATGYQYERERDELQKQLQKVLGLYVSDKPSKWQKIFPWTFYKQLFRLWGQPFTVEMIVKPGFIGILTNKYIYQNLPKGVLERLKDKTPKTQKGNYKHKLHQLLTTEIGREDFKKNH